MQNIRTVLSLLGRNLYVANLEKRKPGKSQYFLLSPTDRKSSVREGLHSVTQNVHAVQNKKRIIYFLI